MSFELGHAESEAIMYVCLTDRGPHQSIRCELSGCTDLIAAYCDSDYFINLSMRFTPGWKVNALWLSSQRTLTVKARLKKIQIVQLFNVSMPSGNPTMYRLINSKNKSIAAFSSRIKMFKFISVLFVASLAFASASAIPNLYKVIEGDDFCGVEECKNHTCQERSRKRIRRIFFRKDGIT